MNNHNFVEKPKNTRLTTWQLGDLVLSNINLLDINPADGTSSIMQGLSRFEYGTAMAIRRVIKNDMGRTASYMADVQREYDLHRARTERSLSELDIPSVSR